MGRIYVDECLERLTVKAKETKRCAARAKRVAKSERKEEKRTTDEEKSWWWEEGRKSKRGKTNKREKYAQVKTRYTRFVTLTGV